LKGLHIQVKAPRVPNKQAFWACTQAPSTFHMKTKLINEKQRNDTNVGPDRKFILIEHF